MPTLENFIGSLKGMTPKLVVKRTLELIHEPGEVFEIRVPRPRGGTISGYFNDPDQAAAAIGRLGGMGSGIYATVNPVDPALLARQNNKLDHSAFVTTNDAEITKRRWFLLDLDPVRRVGISASNEELEESQTQANMVREWLTSLGWPEPLEAISGNGIHLMYRIDLPNTDEVRAIVEFATKMLSSIFNTDRSLIDTTSWNASRIWKVYGTLAAKGSNTPERPHRMAIPTSVPEEFRLVTLDQLNALADGLRQAKNEEFKDMTGEYIADMEKWLTERGLTVTSGPRPLYGNEGKKWTVARCPFNPQHTNPMVGVVNNRPVYKCLHNSCSAFRWKDFREKIDPTYQDPDTVKQRAVAWLEGEAEDVDQELLETICRLGGKTIPMMKAIKKDAPKDRWLLLESKVKAEKRRFIIDTMGDNNEKGNVLGLVQRTHKWMQDGFVPCYWTSELDGRVMAGEIGSIKAERANETHEIDLMLKFHAMGDVWVKQTHAKQVLGKLAVDQRANPLKNYMNSLVWDNVPRIETWLIDYMGTKDNIYTRAVGRKWLISMAARALDPGCQVDHMLIMEGKQGIGKSQALRILGGEYYVEYSRAVSSNTSAHKDMVAAIIGKLVVEMSELATLKKADIETLKAILTTTVDEARLAYERDSKMYPRTCVVSGTTNEEDSGYINDATGARRFWPVKVGECGRVNTPSLRVVRDQLIAEAVHAYEAGEDWFTVPEEEVRAEQQARQVTSSNSDSWFHVIRDSMFKIENYENECWVAVPEFVKGTATGKYLIRQGKSVNILSIILGIEVERQNFSSLLRVKAVLKELGFKKTEPAKRPLDGGRYAQDLTEEGNKKSLDPLSWPALMSIIARIPKEPFPGARDGQ